MPKRDNITAQMSKLRSVRSKSAISTYYMSQFALYATKTLLKLLKSNKWPANTFKQLKYFKYKQSTTLIHF